MAGIPEWEETKTATVLLHDGRSQTLTQEVVISW